MHNTQENIFDVSVEIEVQEGAELPHYASHGAAGFDVRAFLKEPIIIEPGEHALIPTGLKVAIPPGYELQARPRSGLALKNQITLLNSPGTIDSDYRGEICIILINHGKQSFKVETGMRIAQLVLAPYRRAQFIQKNALSETIRGNGGFGHTGIH